MIKKIYKLTLMSFCFPLLIQTSASHAAQTQQAPGNSTRPELTPQEVATFTQQNYFSRGGLLTETVSDAWEPDEHIKTDESTPWVVGKDAAYQTVQQALNAALNDKSAISDGRIYIKILPGTYVGTLYIPADAPPVTLFGSGEDPALCYPWR
jgi:pectinesterase